MDLALFPLDTQTCHLRIASCEYKYMAEHKATDMLIKYLAAVFDIYQFIELGSEFCSPYMNLEK